MAKANTVKTMNMGTKLVTEWVEKGERDKTMEIVKTSDPRLKVGTSVGLKYFKNMTESKGAANRIVADMPKEVVVDTKALDSAKSEIERLKAELKAAQEAKVETVEKVEEVEVEAKEAPKGPPPSKAKKVKAK